MIQHAKAEANSAWLRALRVEQLGQAAISPRMGPHLALQKHARHRKLHHSQLSGSVMPGEVLQASGA